MRYKGRIQLGTDADLLVFELAKIKVNATLQNTLTRSTGMRYVIVNGTPVIAAGERDLSAKPGRPARREVKTDD